MSNAKGTKLKIYHPSFGWKLFKDFDYKVTGISGYLGQGWKTQKQIDRIESTRQNKRDNIN